MLLAQAMTQGSPLPAGTTLLGYIDRHPADKHGLGYAVLIYHAIGIEVAWDGQSSRSLPNQWRRKVKFTAANPAAILGGMGGSVSTPAKAKAARINGRKGGWPKGRKRGPRKPIGAKA